MRQRQKEMAWLSVSSVPLSVIPESLITSDAGSDKVDITHHV